VRTQKHPAVGVDDRLGHRLALLPHPERVVRRTRRVAGRRVQSGEVVVVELDLGTLGDAIPEADEDVLDLAHRLADEVLVARRERLARQGDVDALAGQRGVEGSPLQFGLARLDQGLELAAHDVAEPAEHGTFLRIERVDRAEHLDERALAAQCGDARLLERRKVVGVEDGLAAGGEERREARRTLLQLGHQRVVHAHPFPGREPARSEGAPGGAAAPRAAAPSRRANS